MKISVILTTYNMPEHLDRVLYGYGMQTCRDFELVLADDGSGEKTRRVFEFHRDKWGIPFRHVWQEDKGFRKTRILNKAIHETDADYLIFSDGDFVPKPNLVAAHRNFAKEGQYIVGSYNRLPKKTTALITVDDILSQRVFNPIWLIRHGYFPLRGGLRIYLPTRIGEFLDRFGEADWGRFPGGNSSCFREDALAVGGFDETLGYGGLDRDFGTRLAKSGISSRRMKHATYVLHLEHGRPYANQTTRN